jgi:pimeloyl-ACP methyl ester carboxylesterase
MPANEIFEWNWRGQPLQVGVTRLGVGPVLLLLPALSSVSTRAELRALQERLAVSCATVSIDWPGFGDLAKPFVDWRPAVYRAFLADVVTNVAPRPRATIAVGHGAGYALGQAEAAPGSAGALCLIAPTWRGPMPTLSGKSAASFEYLARLVDAPRIGPLIYALNVNPLVIGMMLRGHVYADPRFVTPRLFAEKMTVTRAPGARHASARFVAGLLDPATSRAAFLAAARRLNDAALVIYGADTPAKSRGEMEALAALPNIRKRILRRGKLAVEEEYPAEVAAEIEAFLRALG